MTLTTAAVVLIVVLIVAGITGLLLLLPRLARPTVPFGVRVPTDKVDAPAVRRANSVYRRGLLISLPALIALLVALAGRLPAGVVLAAAALAPMVSWLVLYVYAHRTVRAAKLSERWYEGVRQAVLADTSLRTNPPPYPWLWAVPAIAVTVSTLAVGIARYPALPDQIATRRIGADDPALSGTTVWSAFAIVGLQLLLTLALLGLTAVTVRGKADLIATAPATSAAQYRRYAAAMARGVLLLAAGVNVTLLLLALRMWDLVRPSNAWYVATVLPPLAAAAVLVAVVIRFGQSGHRLPATSDSDETTRPGVEQRDDDAHWILGLLYLNRDDPAFLVPARFGDVGWKVNLAHPAAWVLTAAVLLLTAACLLLALG